MNRSIFAFAMLVVCASWAAYVGPGQSSAPRPESFVSVVGHKLRDGPVKVGERFTVYEVPADMWLVVTAVGPLSGDGAFALLEERNGEQFTPKLTMGGGAPALMTGGPIGLSFRPGSRVVVHNVDAGAALGIKVPGTTFGLGRWYMVGHLMARE